MLPTTIVGAVSLITPTCILLSPKVDPGFWEMNCPTSQDVQDMMVRRSTDSVYTILKDMNLGVDVLVKNEPGSENRARKIVVAAHSKEPTLNIRTFSEAEVRRAGYRGNYPVYKDLSSDVCRAGI